MLNSLSMSRRSALTLAVGIGTLIVGGGQASERSMVTVHKDSNCGVAQDGPSTLRKPASK